MFWKNKPLTSQEYTELSSKVFSLSQQLAEMKLHLERIDMSSSNLRGIVSRKLGGVNNDQQEISKEEIDEIKGFLSQFPEFRKD